MTIVYVVEEMDYDEVSSEVRGVFTSYELAEDRVLERINYLRNEVGVESAPDVFNKEMFTYDRLPNGLVTITEENFENLEFHIVPSELI
jgi:hypothetical protein